MERKIRNLDKELRKDIILRTIMSFSSIFLLTFFIYLFFIEYMHKAPSVSVVKGNVMIYSNGIWIPVRAGVSLQAIKDTKIRVVNGTITLGNNIRIQSDYAEVKIAKGEISVVGGEVSIMEQNRQFELRTGDSMILTEKYTVPEEKEKEKLYPETGAVDIDEPRADGDNTEGVKTGDSSAGDDIATGTENAVADADLDESKSSEESRKDEEKPRWSIEDFSLQTKQGIAHISVKAQGINKIYVNRIVFLSQSGDFSIAFPLTEGENRILVEAETPDGNILKVAERTIFVDLTPPKINIGRLKASW